jgi:hypothetical protein
VPVVRGVAFDSDEQAEGYLLADNRHTELGGWDDGVLAEALSDLAAADHLHGVGWDADDVDKMLGQLDDSNLYGEGAQDQSGELGEGYQVLVTVEGEVQQAELLSRLTEEGYSCRALIL